MRHTWRRLGVRATVVAAGLAAVAITATTAHAAGDDLAAPTRTATVIRTGTAAGPNLPTLVGVRVGRHDRYDRTVFDFTGRTPGYRVGYGALYHQAKDEVIPVAGTATLVVTFDGVKPGTDLNRVLNPRFPTLRQIRSSGSFEGYAGFGLGLNDRVGFRVFTLRSPYRVVVDVAHQPAQPFQTTAYGYTGNAPDVSVQGVRWARHPGYDRIVFGVAGPHDPTVDVSYLGSGSTLRVRFAGEGSADRAPHASYSGPATYRFGLPEARSLSFTVVGAGVMTADVRTAHRHGFRVMLLHQPTRVVLDVRY
jgi:hypothetical protein